MGEAWIFRSISGLAEVFLHRGSEEVSTPQSHATPKTLPLPPLIQKNGFNNANVIHSDAGGKLDLIETFSDLKIKSHPDLMNNRGIRMR